MGREDYRFPKIFFPALFLLIVFELSHLIFLDRWLNQWLIFRLHLPELFVFGAIAAVGLLDYYEYHGFGAQEGIVRRGPHKLYVAITFDDGPSPKFTPQILDILREKQAPATFFMVGRHVEKYPEVARRVFAEGHEIGNHTYSHRDLVPATKKTILKELQKTDDALKNVIGIRTRLFRPPRGIISNASRKLLIDKGFTVVLWTLSAIDWRQKPPHKMVRRVARHIRPGGIILFHDSGALVRSEGGCRGNTVKALPLVIDELRRRGYEIVDLSRMINEHSPVAEDDFIEVLTASAGQEF